MSKHVSCFVCPLTSTPVDAERERGLPGALLPGSRRGRLLEQGGAVQEVLVVLLSSFPGEDPPIGSQVAILVTQNPLLLLQVLLSLLLKTKHTQTHTHGVYFLVTIAENKKMRPLNKTEF